MISNAFYLSLRRYQEKIVRHGVKAIKTAYFALRDIPDGTRPVFVLGYGRSGTSMLLNSFERDMRVEVFGENDPRIANNYMLIYENIEPAITNSKANIVVLKPILNSFDAIKILNRYRDSRVIWLIRGYRDVVASANKKFGSEVANYIREYVRLGYGSNWLSSGMPEKSLTYLRGIPSDDFTDNDWMALVWWSVNRCVIADELLDNDRFMLIEYEKLVVDIEYEMKNLYRFIGLPYRHKPDAYMHSGSLGKGSTVTLSPIVEKMCESLADEITNMISKKRGCK